MNWFDRIFRIALMLTFLSIVSIVGWQEISEDDSRLYQQEFYREHKLRKEFEKKAGKAANLPVYRQQFEVFARKLVALEIKMKEFNNHVNILEWRNWLSHTLAYDVSFKLLENTNREFYSEQLVKLQFETNSKNISQVFSTLSDEQKMDLDLVYWRNLTIKRAEYDDTLIFVGTVAFISWLEEDE